MLKSQSKIVRQAAIDAEIIEEAGNTQWASYYNFLPEFKKNEVPMDIVSLRDTVGTITGRNMKVGSMLKHPGIQVMVRSQTESTGREKINAIHDYLLETLRNTHVQVESIDFTIVAFTLTSDIIQIPLPNDLTHKMFSLNGTVSIT